MLSLSVNSISKSYGSETILNKVSFTLSPGERLGLVGPNGCGKTTLLRLLVDKEQPDAGRVHWSVAQPRFGYLPQGLTPAEGDTLGGFLSRQGEDVDLLTERLEELSAALAQGRVSAALQGEYDSLLSRIRAAAESVGRSPAVLSALGLADYPPETPVTVLSGGQKTRLALAGVLLSSPEVLFLDEPTNHLDITMLEWLEGWLLGYRGAALVVSHDRAFLDRVATGILELDIATHRVRPYAGSYTAYLEQKLAEQQQHAQAYRDQLDEIEKLQGSIAQVRHISRFKRGGKADTGDKFAKGYFADRSKGTVARAKHLEARLESLLNEDAIEKPRTDWQLKVNFGPTPASGRDVLRLEALSIGYGEKVMLSGLNLGLRHGARVALVGPNGSGKTTLLRTIAGLLPPLSGQVYLGANVHLGYMAQEQEDLDLNLDAFNLVRGLAPFSDTEVRAFLHQYLFSGDDVFIPLGKLSYGERARLSLACQVARGCNLLLLDEPINHLDIPSRARFEHALVGFQGTVLAVVHDRYFIEGFAKEVWEVTEGGVIVPT